MHTYIRTHTRARTHTHTHTHTHIDIYIYRDIDACVIGLDLARFVLFLSLPKRTVPWVCAHTFNNNNNNNNNTHTRIPHVMRIVLPSQCFTQLEQRWR